MRILCSILILLPHLDRLVRLARDKSQSTQIESRAHDTRLCIKRTRLRDRIFVLEPVTGLPVPEGHTAVVASGEKDIVFVDGERVDDAVVAFKVLHEVSAWAEPLLDLTW